MRTRVTINERLLMPSWAHGSRSFAVLRSDRGLELL